MAKEIFDFIFVVEFGFNFTLPNDARFMGRSWLDLRGNAVFACSLTTSKNSSQLVSCYFPYFYRFESSEVH